MKFKDINWGLIVFYLIGILAIVGIAMLFVGCQDSSYRHRTWDRVTGKLTSDTQVKNRKAMAGTKTTDLKIVLPDGASLDVNDMELTPDPNSAEAIGKVVESVADGLNPASKLLK